MILCEIDSNVIISEPMRNRTASKMVRAFTALMKRLKAAGIKPKKHILDNEASEEYKQAIKEQKMTYELVPKGQHRRNVAERAIQTWKAHMVGVLSGLPPTFPLSLWDELTKQVDMQVNMLRFSNVAPKVCSWSMLNGQHDFNRHPLAPLGVEMHMLEPPRSRRSWGVHSKRGHYVGTSLEHYRYYNGYFSETHSIRGSESVIFKHKYITTPTVTPEDAIVAAAKELERAIRGYVPPPLAKSGIDQIKELTNIFDITKVSPEERAEVLKQKKENEEDSLSEGASRSGTRIPTGDSDGRGGEHRPPVGCCVADCCVVAITHRIVASTSTQAKSEGTSSEFHNAR